MITLKTLREASAQAVFDQAATHLLTQNKQSQLPAQDPEYCAYRGESGLKCAAGCFLADDEYDSSMENSPWYALVTSRDDVPAAHQSLILALQTVHDRPGDSGEWPERLIKVAKFAGLDYSVVTNFVRQPVEVAA
jgi:hypothetical protein